VRIVQANLEGLERLSARKTLHPSKVLPKPDADGATQCAQTHSDVSVKNLCCFC